MKKIKKIVLTGGPCGGKTIALETIEKKLTELNYKVLIVPESATTLINSGIIPDNKYLSIYDFQDIILKHQLSTEKTYEIAAKKTNHDNIIIICDRGVIDNKAYISKKEFEQLLKENDTNEITLKDNYNSIFHLVTTAKGAEKFYTLKNNAARSESIDNARKLDERIKSAWNGHEYIRIIDNSTDFKQKINRLTNEVFRFLGNPIPLQDQRKFIIRMPHINTLKNTIDFNYTKIKQIYLYSKIEERLRIRECNGVSTYFYTTKKSTIDSSTKIKTNERITEKKFYNLLQREDKNLNRITKERYTFIFKNQYFRIDIFPFWKDVAIMEIELTEQNNKLDFPPQFKFLKEITEDYRFRNIAIAHNIPKIDV